jgi:ElaB/YqjD/DUF883 family membrane-anchored ribosome-binding protein
MGETANPVRGRAGQTGTPTGTPRADGDAPEVAAIKADIEETRAEMTETIDEIEDRLSPRNLAEQAKTTVREATVGRIETMMNSASDRARGLAGQGREMAGGMTERMKESPIPYVLIGVGVGWLLLNSRGNGGSVTYKRDLANRGWSTGRYRENDELWEEEDEGQSWSESVGDMAARARERMGYTRQRVGDYGSRTQGSLDSWIRQNPLAFGIAALAVGAAIGLSLPETETENEWMGETRDTLVERAQELKENAVETVQETIAGKND